MSQAWKGMLDGEYFMEAGWLHSAKLHTFQVDNLARYLVMGKVD